MRNNIIPRNLSSSKSVLRGLERMPASYRAEPCKDVRRRVVDNAMRTGKNAFPLTTMSAAFVKAVQS